MAITKIHAIQAIVNKAVDYICNPAKTDESILISELLKIWFLVVAIWVENLICWYLKICN